MTDDAGRWLIVVCEGKTTEHRLPEEGVVMVGRAPGCDIVVEHRTLSRNHAKLTIGKEVTVEDCGSQNGVLIEGHRLSPGEVVSVAPGAPMEVGDALLLLRVGVEERAADTPSFWNVVERVSSTAESVFLYGEPGVGKDFAAECILQGKPRPTELVCPNVTREEQLEAAVADAGDGWLLVREPALLPTELQVHLASVLPGTLRTLTISQVDPTHLAEPLARRLGVVVIAVPPLRERSEEVEPLAQTILRSIAEREQMAPALLSAEALGALKRHNWPGNVRELEGVLTRAALARSGRVITSAHLSLDETEDDAEIEHRLVLDALQRCHGNQTEAAKLLGISRGTLIARLSRQGT